MRRLWIQLTADRKVILIWWNNKKKKKKNRKTCFCSLNHFNVNKNNVDRKNAEVYFMEEQEEKK